MFKKILAVMVIGFALAGCGDSNSGNTIDFSTPEAVDKSVSTMGESLKNEADKKTFQDTVTKVMYQAMMEFEGDEAKAMEFIKEKLSGKTAEQIIKEYGGNN